MKKLLLKSLIVFAIFGTLISFADNGEGGKNQNKQVSNKNNSSFSNDLFSGVAAYNYNFSFLKGINGLTPNLGVSYNSSKIDLLNNSGYGFDLSIDYIFRSTKKGNDKLYTSNDFAINSSVSSNELQNNGSGSYIGVLNNDNNKYIFENDSWIVYDQNGNKYYFGNDDLTKQINPENKLTYKWLLSKIEDKFGNYVTYTYFKKDKNIYLSEINYGFYKGAPLYKVSIEYLKRNFSASSYTSGFKIENHNLLSKIILNYNNNGTFDEVKHYELIYKNIETSFPKLVNIKEVSGELIGDNIKFDYYSYGIGVNLLSKIDNGKGLNTILEYKSSALYKNTTVPFILKTLYKITYEDTITGLKYSNTYDYYGGNFYFDPTNIYNRGYTGFSKVKVIDDDGTYKMLYFHQSDTDKNNKNDALIGEFQDHISKKGKIYREETYDENNNIYTSKITKWINLPKNQNTYYILPARVTNILFNKDKNHIDSSETFDYDSLGNTTEDINYGEVNADINTGDFTDIKTDKTINKVSYAIDDENLLNNKICTSWQYSFSGELLSLSKNIYDNLAECKISNGLVTSKSLYYKEEDRFLSQKFVYNKWLLTSKSDFLGNTEKYTYDEFGLLLNSTINAKGFTQKLKNDYRVQKPIETEDVNGVKSILSYDNFGRVLTKSVLSKDVFGTKLLEVNTYNTENLPNYVESKKYLDEANYILSRVYIDGNGNQIEAKTSTKYSDKYSTVKQKYDKNGNNIFTTYPIFENDLEYLKISGTEKGNILKYDALGRLVSQTNKTGTTKLEYDLLKTTYINQKGVKKDQINDIFGNLVKVIEYNGNENYVTSYFYNENKKLIKFVDAKENIRNLYYDSLSRLIKFEDLHESNSQNFGFQTYVYNDNSNLIKKSTIGKDDIVYSYDELGRIKSINLDGNIKTFDYDEGNNGKGTLSRITNGNYIEEYKYNYLGQKIESNKFYQSLVYSMKYNYDFAGNLLSITYPDNKSVNYIFENGYIDKLKYNNKEILSSIDYLPNNSAYKFTYTNGLVSQDLTDYEYGYRLIGKQANIGDKYYQNLNYTFDSIGNITNITDNSNNGLIKNSTYTYDDLTRLLGVQTVDGNNESTSINYSYDSIGNITNNSKVGEYNYQNGINPHSLSAYGSGNTISYDKNGNINSETINGITKNYKYNSLQELQESEIGGIKTIYNYDNSSTRVQKLTQNGNTINVNRYIEDYYEDENQIIMNGEEVSKIINKASKYVFVGGIKILTVLNSGGNESIIYNLSDHLGGGNIDLDGSGNVLQKSDYLPYGQTRVLDRADNYKNNYLFTGKELDDETGLQYFEARYYNGEIGRFYSQDRVFWELGNTKRGINILQDPQQLNSYAYARNNPIIYSDPSGETALIFAGGGDNEANANLVGIYTAFVTQVGLSIALTVDKTIDKLYWEPKMDSIMNSTPNTKINNQVKSVSVGGSPGGGKKPKKDHEYDVNNSLDGSKSTYTGNNRRIDVEAPSGGVGNVHLQSMVNKAIKYFYNKSANTFVDKAGNLAPNSIQKLLNGKTGESQAIIKGINKAFEKYLKP